MAITVKHKFVSTIPDDPDATLIRPSNWNDTHDLVGTVPIANGGTNATTAADALTNLGAFPATSTTGTGSVVLATGATQAHPTISDYEIFTSTTPPSYAEGRVWFDSLNHTLAQFNDVTNNTVHLGEEIQLKVINNTGSTINIGQPVYITGTSSGQTYPNVALAIANSLTTANVIGLANQAIPNGTAGYVTTIGLIQGINTGAYTVGDTLYLSPYSAGFYQNTIPPTGYAVKLGTVAYVNSSTGAIYINKSNLSVQAGNIVGQVSVANGGTGASTLTGYVKGSGTSALTASSTIPNTDISGLGTMSMQNANAVAVTGGTIDNTVIGGTTPAAGTFNTLIGGKSSTTYVTITGDASYPMIQATGGTNTPLVLSPLGTGALQAQKTDSTATGGNARGANAVDWQTSRGGAGQVSSGSYSNILGGISNTSVSYASAVVGGTTNYGSGTASFLGGGGSNTTSGNYSVLVGGGANTTSGYYNFVGGGYTNSGTSGSAVTTQSGTMNGTTAVTLSGSNASIKVGQYITGTSIAGDTYVAAISGTSLTLSKNASGSGTATLSFYTPHGVVVGGGNNQATGSYSFIGGGGDAGTAGNRNVASGDWSFVGGGIKNTASGAGAFMGGGGYNNGVYANTASGVSSVVGGGTGNNNSGLVGVLGGGYFNTTNSTCGSIIGGAWGTTRGITGYTVFPACLQPVAGVNGASQASLLILGRATTDATATVLTSDSSAANGTNQVILPNNSAYYFRGEVVSGVTGGGNTKGWYIEGVIKRGANAGATTLVGSTATSLYADAGAATWTIGLTADTTNGGLAVTFTGQAATTIRTVCQIRTTEMTY
jgi:hypothetical protein